VWFELIFQNNCHMNMGKASFLKLNYIYLQILCLYLGQTEDELQAEHKPHKIILLFSFFLEYNLLVISGQFKLHMNMVNLSGSPNFPTTTTMPWKFCCIFLQLPVEADRRITVLPGGMLSCCAVKFIQCMTTWSW